jgi:hypothetical protein
MRTWSISSALLLGMSAGLISPRELAAQRVDISIVDDRSVHVPYEYEVEEGDTLWLISQEFFNDPLLWPNLWALNPTISNPHWIYPGDIVRLKWNPQAAQDSAGDDFELEPVTYSTDIQKVARRVRNTGLILEAEAEPLATIVASPEPREGLATGDRVYLKVPQLDQVQLGQSLSVYRELSVVEHPTTGDEVGRKVALIATLEVVERGGEGQLVKAVITQAHREVMRGDIVVAESQSILDISPVKNFVDLKGVILDDLDGYSELGQHHLVFVDLGSEQGVQVGNRLSIARRGDGVRELDEGELEKLPLEPVGELLIIALQARSSTALITRSTLELKRGDRVFMLRNY